MIGTGFGLHLKVYAKLPVLDPKPNRNPALGIRNMEKPRTPSQKTSSGHRLIGVCVCTYIQAYIHIDIHMHIYMCVCMCTHSLYIDIST